MSRKLIPFVALLVANGCGHPPAGSVDGVTPAEAPVSRDRDLISQRELSDPALKAQSVLDVVRSLRPQFLTERGKNSHSDDEAGKVHASVDNGRIVPVDELQNIHVATVMEIRYLNIAAAMQRFGGAAREGPVILVRLLK
jgi:hypothetical protein